MTKFLRAIAHSVWRRIDFYVLCLHRKDVYLRKQGVQIGSDCQIITDIRNFASEPYLIRIGNRVTITAGVKFITHDASTRLFRNQLPEMNDRFGNLFGPIIIGDNCFVGVDTVLLPNTIIGNNCIVGAGAVVKGQFPDNSVIVGVPARRISSLEEYIEKVRGKMVPLKAQTRDELRQELMAYYFKDQ
jgi:acetyltransferase-like isoleucine patch superfamily enzyme